MKHVVRRLATIAGLGMVSLAALEYVLWNFLSSPCDSAPYILHWKGLTKCVGHTVSIIWHVSEVALYACAATFGIAALTWRVIKRDPSK